MGEVEHHDIGILVMTDDVETVVIRCLQETVIAVDELDIFALSHRHARVPGCANATVLLTHINNLVAISEQVVHRTFVRTVVHDDNLPLRWLETQPQDAVDTFA